MSECDSMCTNVSVGFRNNAYVARIFPYFAVGFFFCLLYEDVRGKKTFGKLWAAHSQRSSTSSSLASNAYFLPPHAAHTTFIMDQVNTAAWYSHLKIQVLLNNFEYFVGRRERHKA